MHDAQRATPLCSNKGDIRATMKIPAVTIVAAWINAEMGVGPSIESGSQTCSGTCADLPIAPTNRQMHENVSGATACPEMISMVCRRALGVPNVSRVIERAVQVRERRDAEQEAEVADAVDEERLHVREIAVGRVYQKPIRRYDTTPTASQPKNSCRKLLLITSISIDEGEQRDVAEEPGVARVVAHVADGVDVHDQRDEGDDGHHQGGEAVDQEADLDPDAVAGQPV